MSTVLWQRFEGLAILAIALIYFIQMGSALPVWAAVLIFFAPDLSFAAYAFGPKFGAFVYNVMHIYALGALIAIAGYLTGAPVLLAVGILWCAHCGFDRALGYGLKSTEGFKHTHLGTL